MPTIRQEFKDCIKYSYMGFFLVHFYYINWQRHAFSIKYVTHLDNISHRVSKNNVVIS